MGLDCAATHILNGMADQEALNALLAGRDSWNTYREQHPADAQTRVDLTAANLIGAVMVGARLLSADLYGADLTDAVLVGASMDGTDLSNATLVGANLAAADLGSSAMLGADFSGANLAAVSWNDVVMWPEGFTPPSA